MHNNENLRCHFLRPMVLQQFSGSKMVVFSCVVIINVLSCTLAAGGSGIHHLEVDCYTLQMLRCTALTAGKLPANSMQIACRLCRAKMAVKESKFEWSCFWPCRWQFQEELIEGKHLNLNKSCREYYFAWSYWREVNVDSGFRYAKLTNHYPYQWWPSFLVHQCTCMSWGS